MPKVSVKITGNRIPLLAKGLGAQSTAAARRYARHVYEVAQREVPVDTGALKASGHVRETPSGADVVYERPYAVYVHYGTSRMPPNPWLTRAVAQTDAEWRRVLADIKDFLERGG